MTTVLADLQNASYEKPDPVARKIYEKRERERKKRERWNTRKITFFTDVHTNGNPSKPLEYKKIVIWGDRTKAIRIFIDRFGTSPEKIDCHCCGPRYNVATITENELLESAFHKGNYNASDIVLNEPNDFEG